MAVADLQVRAMRLRQTTSFRLTALMGVAFLGVLYALLGLIYVLTANELVGRTDEVLGHAAKALAAAPPEQLAQQVRNAIAAHTSHLNHYALIGADGQLLAGDFTPPARLDAGRPIDVPAGPGDTLALRVLAVRTSGGRTLVVGRDTTQIADLRHRVTTILVSSGVATSALVLVLAIGLSLRPLRRVRTLTAHAARIAAGELGLRMPVSPRGDELDVIAATVNAMVEEIARLLEQVKGATDAIAHDLRSPLAQIRSRLDKIRRQAAIPSRMPVSPEGAAPQAAPTAAAPDPPLAGMIEAAMEELDLVLARFNALLRVAELEATNRQAGFGPLDPMALAAAVCELFEPLAEERHIRLELSGSWGQIIRGDDKLLFEVLSNLVENAIKFIPSGGRIAVDIGAKGGIPELVVRDNGPGIPLDERASVLRRFHRGSCARHTPGSGLGLSLVAAIVQLHGFELALEDGYPGLVVRIICHAVVN